jgi:hypothetical protein
MEPHFDNTTGIDPHFDQTKCKLAVNFTLSLNVAQSTEIKTVHTTVQYMYMLCNDKWHKDRWTLKGRRVYSARRTDILDYVVTC